MPDKISTMSFRDPKYEFVRVRSKKDKDRHGDSRSVGGSTSSRKHRSSAGSSQGGHKDDASQITTSTYQDLSLDQLPPLPEERVNGDSASTSPLMRTTSNTSAPTSQVSLSSIHTPASIRPYLESECDDSASTITTPTSTADPRELIGPETEADINEDEPSNTQTPTPSSISRFEANDNTPRPVIGDSPQPGMEADSNDTASQVTHSWSGMGSVNDQSYPPSQWSNPFLPMPVTTGPPPNHQAMASQAIPQHINYGPASHVSSSPGTVIERPAQAGSPALSNATTHTYSHRARSSVSVNPMYHTQSNPLPYSTSHNSPAYLLQRISSAIPDICSLVEVYQQTCGVLSSRETQIFDLEEEKAAESERQGNRIEKLQSDIKSILKHKTEDIERLERENARMDKKNKKLNDSYLAETKLKEEAKAGAQAVQKALEHAELEYQQDKREMTHLFAEEKGKMISDHTHKERDLKDQMHTEARIAEATLSARVAEMTRKLESEKRTLDDRWIQHNCELEDKHTKSLREKDSTLSTKQKLLDDERQTYIRAKESWDREREAMTIRWDAERALLRKAAEDQKATLEAQHCREREEMRSSHNNELTQQNSETQKTITRVQKERDDVGHTLELFQIRHHSEIHNATLQFQKEKEDFRKEVDTAQTRQRAEYQDSLTKLQRENQDLRTSQSQDNSRARGHISDLQREVDQLKRESQELLMSRGQSQSRESAPARETILRLQREVEQLRTGWNADKDTLALLRGENQDHLRSGAHPQSREPSLAREATAKLQRETEQSKSIWTTNRSWLPKLTPDSSPSRPATPKEEKVRPQSHITQSSVMGPPREGKGRPPLLPDIQSSDTLPRLFNELSLPKIGCNADKPKASKSMADPTSRPTTPSNLNEAKMKPKRPSDTQIELQRSGFNTDRPKPPKSPPDPSTSRSTSPETTRGDKGKVQTSLAQSRSKSTQREERSRPQSYIAPLGPPPFPKEDQNGPLNDPIPLGPPRPPKEDKPKPQVRSNVQNTTTSSITNVPKEDKSRSQSHIAPLAPPQPSKEEKSRPQSYIAPLGPPQTVKEGKTKAPQGRATSPADERKKRPQSYMGPSTTSSTASNTASDAKNSASSDQSKAENAYRGPAWTEEMTGWLLGPSSSKRQK